MITLENAIAQFWHQPDYRILELWQRMKRKKLEDVNDSSRATAALTASVVAFMRSFGGSSADNPDPNDYLPFKIIDPDSPVEQFKRQLSPKTKQIARRLIEESIAPPQVIRHLYQVEGLVDAIFSED